MNSVAPGFIRTNPSTERQWDSYGADGQKALVERIALKRLGSAQDIANAVVFFASDLAGFVNGQILQVDGGRSAGAPPSISPVTSRDTQKCSQRTRQSLLARIPSRSFVK